MNTSVMDRTMDSYRMPVNTLEIAGRKLERALMSDSSAPSLIEQTGITQHGATASGLIDQDYPSLSDLALGLANFTQIKTLNKVPLPPEVMEHFGHMQCHCMMGLFTEINRAWLTIDSDIYVWTYEHGSDVAYFDGLNDTILSVGLVKPKPGVFHNFIKYLLVLTTTADIVVLGVTFSSTSDGPLGQEEEMHLVPDPVFVVPTDGVAITTIAGTQQGRLFLGGKEGSVFEIAYQAESGWFGKRYKKVNHSTGTLSFLVPSFLNIAFGEEESILQIAIDNSRHILYTLTEKGSIEVFDLGDNGTSLRRITKVAQSTLVHQATNVVKTLDMVNFRPIVSISALEIKDSIHINLVAITQTGVRLYLTTIDLINFTANQRPYKLALVHVRLPPGFSANINTVRPKMVHMANCREGACILVSSPGPDHDQLWCLSSDPFPFSQSLMEAYTSIYLDGPAWAMAEVRHQDSYSKSNTPVPPLVVRQHMESPRKYVVLTAQGAHIFIKLRPVDMLKQLLLDTHGPESDAVKNYFHMQREDEACATALILACLESVQNADIAEWATRAFLMYGGEPRIVHNVLAHQTMRGPVMFNPQLMSTPAPAYGNISQIQQTPQPQQQQQQTTMMSPNITMDGGAQVSFSAKHNGLYLYVSRILRPIWLSMCVQKVTTEANKEYLTSVITSDECVWILGHLISLKNFLNKNTQVTMPIPQLAQTTRDQNISYDLNNTSLINQTARTIRQPNQPLQEFQIEERQSIDALKAFVSQACEILGLWKILCEHQFHLLINTLTKEQQMALLNTSFKDLFLFGHDICSTLIISLINSYLGDNASVDSISAKLRDVCPNLYKSEDAACSKANEILLSAKNQQNREERELMLQSALQLCKEIAPNMNLGAACQKFVASQYYHAVIDLCATCARKIDLENIAEHYYKSNEPNEDHEGYQFYVRRMEIYREVIQMLEQLCSQNVVTYTSDIPQTPGPPLRPQEGLGVSHTDTVELTHRLLNEILASDDELLHVAVYEWMLNKQMFSELLSINQRSLENYLVRATKHNPDAIAIYDLLWKYYEKNQNHSSAAQILNTLATRPGQSVSLKQRLEYLARAVMCMRSETVGYAPHLGLFLRDLEDKIEIGKVQEKILNAIVSVRSTHEEAQQAVTNLNANLYDITQLYEDFAEPFGLWECQLAIIHCSGHTDSTLIEKIWKNIIRSTLKMTKGNVDDKFMVLLNKIRILWNEYKESEKCFPLAFILDVVEQMSCKMKASYYLIPHAFVEMGIPLGYLITKYHRLMATHENDMVTNDDEYHLYKSLAEVIKSFLTIAETINNAERRKIISQSQDIIAEILTKLYSRSNTEELVAVLRNLQSRLNRL